MITGKLILSGTIKLLSPAIIGCGRDERADVDVLKDKDGTPYIPATSLAGVLRHALKFVEKQEREKYYDFWGDGDRVQSSIIIEDLYPEGEVKVGIRDGVKIDNKRGIAQKKAKFDYEIIEPGAEFKLMVEITLGKDDDFKKRMLATVVDLLESEKITIGAKTRSGFGKVNLNRKAIYLFDFSKKCDLLRWLKREFPEPTTLDVKPFRRDENQLIINAQFTLKNSLIVRSYNIEPNLPDTEHIKSNGKPILPGTSIKGAVRARAERIINTLGKPLSIIEDLFGKVDEEKKEARRGRIIIEETVLESYPSEIQTRIKIDRFTGGVMEGALVETMPLFSTREGKNFNIRITIEDCKPHEAGLILLVLKDLWTGDLPIGGEKSIGRGVLKGKEAEIRYNGESFKIPENLSQFSDSEKKKLQSYVDSLVKFGG